MNQSTYRCTTSEKAASDPAFGVISQKFAVGLSLRPLNSNRLR
jgi:hypothetical protein